MRYSKNGFTLIEMTVVMLICSLLLYVGTRSVSNYIDQERFQETVVEMEQIQKALLGDESIVALGQRAEFGFWGDNASWPANGAALSGLEPYMDVEAARSGEITKDAWKNTYVVSSAASTWTLLSRGRGGAVGGIDEYADISLVIDKDDWENNIVAIYVQDSRGTLLLGADDSNPPYLSSGHLASVVFNEHGGSTLTWHKNSAELIHANGFFYGTNINAGPCSVVVTIANGSGSGGGGNPYFGDYDWRNELTGGVDTYQRGFIIYPIGDSGKPNVLTVKLPGAALHGINEV